MRDAHNLQDAVNAWLDEGVEHSWMNDTSSSGESFRDAADVLVVHGLLADMGKHDEARDQARITAAMAVVELDRSDSDSRRKPKRRTAFLAAVSAIAAGVLIFLSWQGTRSVSAATALDRVIKAACQPLDRTYKIRIVEQYSREKRPRNLPPERWQSQAKENIDGATLHVRGADKYVLIRTLANGQKRITGCDGSESWAFREDGPVHVSSDRDRFRGGLPGHQQDFPSINLHSHLNELRTGYDLELADDGGDLSRLSGVRKSNQVRGPKRVEIWFGKGSGTVQRMLLDGLPRGQGGPKSVALELVDRQDLGSEFFKHASHHTGDREIRYEKE